MCMYSFNQHYHFYNKREKHSDQKRPYWGRKHCYRIFHTRSNLQLPRTLGWIQLMPKPRIWDLTSSNFPLFSKTLWSIIVAWIHLASTIPFFHLFEHCCMLSKILHSDGHSSSSSSIVNNCIQAHNYPYFDLAECITFSILSQIQRFTVCTEKRGRRTLTWLVRLLHSFSFPWFRNCSHLLHQPHCITNRQLSTTKLYVPSHTHVVLMGSKQHHIPMSHLLTESTLPYKPSFSHNLCNPNLSASHQASLWSSNPMCYTCLFALKAGTHSLLHYLQTGRMRAWSKLELGFECQYRERNGSCQYLLLHCWLLHAGHILSAAPIFSQRYNSKALWHGMLCWLLWFEKTWATEKTLNPQRRRQKTFLWTHFLLSFS